MITAFVSSNERILLKLRALTRESLDLEGGRGGGGGGFVGRFVRKIFLDYYINFSKKS